MKVNAQEIEKNNMNNILSNNNNQKKERKKAIKENIKKSSITIPISKSNNYDKKINTSKNKDNNSIKLKQSNNLNWSKAKFELLNEDENKSLKNYNTNDPSINPSKINPNINKINDIKKANEEDSNLLNYMNKEIEENGKQIINNSNIDKNKVTNGEKKEDKEKDNNLIKEVQVQNNEKTMDNNDKEEKNKENNNKEDKNG